MRECALAVAARSCPSSFRRLLLGRRPPKYTTATDTKHKTVATVIVRVVRFMELLQTWSWYAEEERSTEVATPLQPISSRSNYVFLQFGQDWL